MRLLHPPALSERLGSGYYCCIRRTWTTQGREQAPNTSNYAWLIKKARLLRDHNEEQNLHCASQVACRRPGLWLAVAMPICSFLKAFVEAIRCNTTILPLAAEEPSFGAVSRIRFNSAGKLCQSSHVETVLHAKIYCRLCTSSRWVLPVESGRPDASSPSIISTRAMPTPHLL